MTELELARRWLSWPSDDVQPRRLARAVQTVLDSPCNDFLSAWSLEEEEEGKSAARLKNEREASELLTENPRSVY